MGSWHKSFFLVFALGFFSFQSTGYGQEIEDSAEVFLEDYSDEFQEHFFEALKQKGIENYDRAIHSLLLCKKLEPSNTAVTNELAKAYLADKKFRLAQDLAIEAVTAEPTNMWFLQTLMQTLKRQGKTIDALIAIVPYSNLKLKENLAHLLYVDRDYDTARTVIKELEDSRFKNNMNAKVEDAIAHRAKGIVATSSPVTTTQAIKSGPLETYKTNLKRSIAEKKYSQIESIAAEALESYPSQPYFYYAMGVGQNGKKQYPKAVKSLEVALEYLLDDALLQNLIYKELVLAYSAIGNATKANLYLTKIKAKS